MPAMFSPPYAQAVGKVFTLASTPCWKPQAVMPLSRRPNNGRVYCPAAGEVACPQDTAPEVTLCLARGAQPASCHPHIRLWLSVTIIQTKGKTLGSRSVRLRITFCFLAAVFRKKNSCQIPNQKHL